jgi:uncharacterized membrane protein YphA (DoxX/SURF4 family)
MNTKTCPMREDAARIQAARLLARWSLGLVWVYEGLVPKILFPHAHPEQTALVAQSAFCFGTPQRTLLTLGAAQVALGLILLTGWRERAMAALATAWMAFLIVLVAAGRPQMLSDPFGALPKDLCLAACAAVIWLLPATQPRRFP